MSTAPRPAPPATLGGPATLPADVEVLVKAVQDLSLARDLPAIMEVVRKAARRLTGADGATFVLRDGDLCFYAEEDAIAPLWKGKRFPMSACISGWAMTHGRTAVIEDIYDDPRIPVEAYRPTFVKSLAMVPIRSAAPCGAIGNYWARRHAATPHEIELLQALADSTSIALENAALYAELEQRVRERTRELEHANRELEAFSYSVSHDLRAPLRHMQGYARLLAQQAEGVLAEPQRRYLRQIDGASVRMMEMVDALLDLSRVSTGPLSPGRVDLGALVGQIRAELSQEAPGSAVEWVVEDLPTVVGDATLLRQALTNLLANAVKYSRERPRPRVEVCHQRAPGEVVLTVRDNGAGFDAAQAGRLFSPFQRLHTAAEFEGTGVGLALVRRIAERHGGRAWAEGRLGEGASFHLALPDGGPSSATAGR